MFTDSLFIHNSLNIDQYIDINDKHMTNHKANNDSTNFLISIITVVYNGEKTLNETIKSIAIQKKNNIEYIIIDGGSTDKTLSIIEQNKQNIDYYLSEPDDGLYDAMNKGIKVATGKWILFLGCDDQLIPNALENTSKYLINDDTIYYGDVYMPKNNNVYDGEFNLYKIMFRNICQQAIFYPRAVFTKYMYNTDFRIYADYYLNLRCFCDESFYFKYIPVLISYYNDYTGISRDIDMAFLKYKRYFIKRRFPMRYYLLFVIRTFLSGLKRRYF